MLRRGSTRFPIKPYSSRIRLLSQACLRMTGDDLQFLKGRKNVQNNKSKYAERHFHSFPLVSSELSLASSIAETAKNKQCCTSCGVEIQTADSSMPGYIDEKLIAEEKASQKQFRKESDRVFDEVYTTFTEEEQMLLLNASSVPDMTEGSSKIEQEVRSNSNINSDGQITDDLVKKINNLRCLRCHNAFTKNEYFDLEKSPKLNLNNVIRKEKVPQLRNSKVCHVISAQDFPHTLNFSLFNQIENSNQITIVINKGDLVINNVGVINKYILSYFSTLINIFLKKNFENGNLQKKVTINPEQIIVVSSKKSWNIPLLYNKIIENKNVFFVGEANVGKSSLIRSIIFYDYYVQNKNKTKSMIDQLSFEKYLHNKKKVSLIENNVQIPGIFVLPNTTQDILSYKISNNKVTINDLPGFVKSSTQGFGIFSFLNDSWIKHLSKPESEKLQDNKKKSQFNLKKSQYTSIMDGDCYGLGGFAFLVGPENSITQVYSSTHVKGHRFSNFEKALGVAKDPPSALAKLIGVKNGKNLLRSENLQKYIIPPFHGSIDIVIKGLGYITVVPTRTLKQLKQMKLEQGDENMDENKKRASEDEKSLILDYINYNLYEFYAPAELDIYIRESIDAYIYKKALITSKKKSKKLIYNKNLKKMVQLKLYYNSTDKSVKPLDENRKMYSTLYKVPNGVDGDIKLWMTENCLKGKSFSRFDSIDKNGTLKPIFRGMSDKDIDKETQKINIQNIFWNDDLNLL